MTNIEQLFHDADLNSTDQLYKTKKETLKKLREHYTYDLNDKSRMDERSAFKQDFYRDRRFYMLPVILQPEHLVYALENKKAFIKWLLTKNPNYNIPYDPKKRGIWTSLKYGRGQDAKFIDINPYYAARQRDLLFGTNGAEKITAENFRERIRDAQTEQEIKDIELLLNSEWEVDNFSGVVEKIIYVINDDFWQLNWHTNGVEKEPDGQWWLDKKKHEGKRYFSSTAYDRYLPPVIGHFYTQKFKERFARGGSKSAWGSSATGSINALVQLQQEAGMDFCHFVAHDLMFDELQRVCNNALHKTQECGKFNRYESLFNSVPSCLKGGKGWVTPDLVSWSSDSLPKQPSTNSPSVNFELGEEKELPNKPTISKSDQEQQVKDKLVRIKDKLKDPKESQVLNKEEVRGELSDLGIELINLEKKSDGGDESKQEISDLKKQMEELRTQLESDESKQEISDLKKQMEELRTQLESDESKQEISDLKKQMEELRKQQNSDDLKKQMEELRTQLEEVKQSLKSMLEEAKDYALKLFNYFEKENIKQITFEEDGTARVEYENNKNSKTFSAQEIDNHQELSVLKQHVQRSEQKTLSCKELSQIVGSASTSPTMETKKKSHWETYKYFYFVGAGLLMIGGLIVYWLMKRNKGQVEQE